MKELTIDQLKAMQEHGEEFVLVNTLARDRFAETRIPGSVNIPQESPTFAEEVEQAAGGKKQNVVVYCANHHCPSSQEAAKKLDLAGFKHVFDFEGGAEEWRQAGEPLGMTA